MAFWEFLIQKEGDRSWLPLESSKVEVLEGRYRIVAHSRQPNVPIEIRITHDATTEIPPIRRTQKRFSRTNKNGLVVVMPFTRLLPGAWDLRCTSDLMAEMLGEGWQYTIRLQVLPLEIETHDEWEPEWKRGETVAKPIANHTASLDQQAENTPENIPENISGNISENIPENSFKEVDRTEFLSTPENSVADSAPEGTASDLLPLTPPSPLAPDQPPHPEPEPGPSAQVPSAVPVRLYLEQDAYVIQTGQPLTLIGQVEAIDGQADDRTFPLEALQVRLYDPRTSQILIEERQPLTTRTLPFPFTCRITLPDHFQTYLVLGEIILYGTTAEGTSSTLVMQPFSVTTDLHELLEAIANDFSEADVPLPANAAPESKMGYAPDIAAIEAADAPIAPIQFRPSPQQPLPPQLRPADPGKTWQSLNLPSFYEAEAEPAIEPPEEDLHLTTTESAVKSDELMGVAEVANLTGNELSGEEISSGELSSEEILRTEATEPRPLASSQPLLESPLPVPQAFDNDAPIPDWDKPDQSPDEPQPRWLRQNQPIEQQSEKPNSPEEVAFRSLNLQERFWTRLQALVADRELSEWLSTFDDGEFTQTVTATRRSEERDAALTRHEVVVEDELPIASEIASGNNAANNAAPETAEAPSSVPVLPIQQPIPVPQLDVVTGELTSGQLLTVQVKLPDLSYPLFVKLWLVDRQNRSVLEGPYWLTDFAPSGFGDLVCRYELTIPHGCLEVQFEAIAIEMTTQREGDKATVSRQVVPPNLSNLALDELDV